MPDTPLPYPITPTMSPRHQRAVEEWVADRCPVPGALFELDCTRSLAAGQIVGTLRFTPPPAPDEIAVDAWPDEDAPDIVSTPE